MTSGDDKAWGEVKIFYGNGIYNHSGSIHIGPLVITPAAYPFAFVTPGAIPDVQTLVGSIWGALFAYLYPAGWNISAYEIYQNHLGGPQTFVGGGTLSGVGGSSGGTYRKASQVQYNFRTTAGDPAKFVFLDSAQYTPDKSLPGSFATVELTWMNAIIADANVQAHDGHSLALCRDRTWTMNRRLRRHYGMS